MYGKWSKVRKVTIAAEDIIEIQENTRQLCNEDESNVHIEDTVTQTEKMTQQTEETATQATQWE